MFERVEQWWNEQPTIHYRVDEWPYEGPGETEDDGKGDFADDGIGEAKPLLESVRPSVFVLGFWL